MSSEIVKGIVHPQLKILSSSLTLSVSSPPESSGGVFYDAWHCTW